MLQTKQRGGQGKLKEEGGANSKSGYKTIGGGQGKLKERLQRLVTRCGNRKKRERGKKVKERRDQWAWETKKDTKTLRWGKK